MEKFTNSEALISRIKDLLGKDDAPLFEAHIGEWLDKKSEVDLEITPNGPVEVHDELYRGTRYEITIYTRAYTEYGRKVNNIE